MKLLLVAVLVSVAAVSSADTKPLPDTQAARELSENAMKRVADGDVAGAFDVLKPYWSLPEHEVSQLVVQSIQQRSALQSRYGEPVGYEYIAWDAVGDSLVRFTYIEKFSNHPLVWQFYFYKPRDAWQVNSVSWSDQIKLLFH